MLLCIGSAQAEDVLHLYNWNNYISDTTIERFEKQCACRVVQDYYSDNEEMLAKLAAGATGYDIIVPTGNAVEALVRQHALRPLDKSLLPNLKNIDPAYLNTWFDPGNKYSVPYAYTITLIGYNSEKLRGMELPLDSWAVIFEPRYLEKVKGHVTVLDSQRELLAAALKYLGYSVNDTDEAHWKQARDLIIRAKPYWAAFNASSYIKELTVGNIWLVHGYSNDIFQADQDAQKARRGFRILASLPKEGAVLALDSMVLHKSGPRPDLAHRFIDFMLDGRNSSELTNLIGSGNPNLGGAAIHPAGDRTQHRGISRPHTAGTAGNAARSGSKPAPRAVAHLDGNQIAMSYVKLPEIADLFSDGSRMNTVCREQHPPL